MTRMDWALWGRDVAEDALLKKDIHAQRMGLEDYEDGLVDALVNLMHFAERYEISFAQQLFRARKHYAVEKTYDWDEEPGLDPKEEPMP